MDTLTQLNNKIMAERTRQPPTVHEPIDTAPPPPYTNADDSDSDSDSSEDEEPMKLIINANNSVHGSNNLVPTSQSTLADATKFSAILLNTIAQLNNAANDQTSLSRRLHVDLTINCGITVVGNRNVVGNIGLKPKAPTLTPNGFTAATDLTFENVVAGAKRKAEDKVSHVPPASILAKPCTDLGDPEQDTGPNEPEAKRLAAGREDADQRLRASL